MEWGPPVVPAAHAPGVLDQTSSQTDNSRRFFMFGFGL